MTQTKPTVQTILGIDIGTALVGWGVVKLESATCSVVDYGTITTPAHTLLSIRLDMIYTDILQLCRAFGPQKAAVELLYFNRNHTTAMAVSQARGVILLALQQSGVEVVDITPLQAKMAVTGYGKATKKQVQEMVKVILKLEDIPRPDDAADALALALSAVQVASTAQTLSSRDTQKI